MSNPEVPRGRWQQSLATTQSVLEAVRGRSLHFPKLVKAGRVKRVSGRPFVSPTRRFQLIFGVEGLQEHENDAECARTVLIVKAPVPFTLLSNLPAFSPNGALPIELALQIGLGMVRALAALHRCGFVHRLVSPHSFSYTTPPTVDSFVNRLLLTDLSLCLPWPRRPRPAVPFVGSPRYAALRVHDGREQGPATDVQSALFVVAEFAAGRLPWRSAGSLRVVRDLKAAFPRTSEFQRLPREIRTLYRQVSSFLLTAACRDMMLTSPQTALDYEAVQQPFKAALARRGSKAENLPSWLCQPCDE